MGALIYSNSGSEHERANETESVCLRDMVIQFMEETGAGGQPLERPSPQMEPMDANVTEDKQTVNQSQQQFEIFKGIISGSCSAELDLLAETSKSLEMAKKMQQHTECLKLFVMRHLRNVGYNATICISLPKDNNRIFHSGNYEYIDVILRSTNSAKSVRLFVDLDFRAQFEIARPTTEYSALLGLLPKIYVGRALKLQSIVKIMCEGVKNSLKRKGLHLPPWRKYKYMRSIWLDSYKRTAACNSVHDHVHDGYKSNMTSPESSTVTELMKMDERAWNNTDAAGHAGVAEEYLNWGSAAAVLSCKPSTRKFNISRLSCALMDAGLTYFPVKNSRVCV